VGQPVVGVEVACVDEHDNPVPVGERGEVVIRGHNIMKGYYKRPRRRPTLCGTAVPQWRHRYLRRGRLPQHRRPQEGHDHPRGFNVYPRELEEVIVTHPAVSLCAVVGIPDERLGRR